jgi:hypothetical protein
MPMAAESFGLRLRGGGTHQAKTMILNEISTFLDSFAGSADARSLIIDANVLNKRTISTRLVTFRHTPRLAVRSPVKRCGKTTLLDVLARTPDRRGRQIPTRQ